MLDSELIQYPLRTIWTAVGGTFETGLQRSEIECFVILDSEFIQCPLRIIWIAVDELYSAARASQITKTPQSASTSTSHGGIAQPHKSCALQRESQPMFSEDFFFMFIP